MTEDTTSEQLNDFGRDAWKSEPDLVEWIDETTGLACLVQRSSIGAWCGYVAVPTGHPTHGKDYYTYSLSLDDAEKFSLDDIRVMREINDIRVHGGLTYAGNCRKHANAPKDAWWFGFDCAHAGDFVPNCDLIDHPVLGIGKPVGWGDERITYRTLAYAQTQCAALALQLKAIG